MKKMWMDDTENDDGQTAPEREDYSSWRWEEWTPESWQSWSSSSACICIFVFVSICICIYICTCICTLGGQQGAEPGFAWLRQ